MGHTIVLVGSDRPVGSLTRRAFDLAGVPWHQCHREDRGLLTLVLVPSGLALDDLPSAIAHAAREASHTRVRVSVHPDAGELTPTTVDRAFRLLEDQRFTDLMTTTVDVGIVAPAGTFIHVPTGTATHEIADATVFLLARPPEVIESATEVYRLLPFPDPPAPVGVGGPSALLRAADEIVPFFGRSDELARLTMWREADDKTSVLLIHGPGGQGKTRLAVEFARRASSAGWRTLQALHESTATPCDGRKLNGDDVLVVVDYAERWPRHDLADLRRHILALRPGRVRLLLVARHAGYWWKGLANPLLKSGATTDELALGALTDTVAGRRTVFAAARDAFAERLGVAGSSRLRPPGSLDDDNYHLALTLHMAALVVVDAHANATTAPADPGALSTYLLRREQDHWQTMVDNGRIGTRPEAMGRLVAIATLTRSLPPADAVAILTEVGLVDSAAGAQAMIDDHSLCYPPHGPRVLTPLLPDRLGEDFLAECLPDHTSGSGDPWAGRLLESLVTGTAVHEATVLTVLTEAGARWVHVRRDHLVPLLAGRPHLVLRAEATALVTLAGFAELPLLEALAAELPDRHIELDTGIAALSRTLTDFALARTDDRAARAKLYENLAARLTNAGLYDDAVAAGREVIALRRILAGQDPRRYEPGLADALGNLGIDLWHAGLLTESVTAMEEAVDIYRRLASVDPQAYDDDLAAELINLTGALIGMGRHGEALPPVQEATTIFARLRGLDLELASAQRNLAIVLGHLDRYDEAVPAVESAVAIFRRLAVDQPHVHTASLAESLQTLGNQLSGANRQTEALAAAEESVAVQRRLAAANPAAHERGLATALSSLANRYSRAGDHATAVATSEEAVHVAGRSTVPTPVLGVALNNLARHLARNGQPDLALAAAENAIATWQALSDDNSAEFGDRLARALAIREELTRGER